MFYLCCGHHAGCRLPKQSVPFLRERLVDAVTNGCGYQLGQVSQWQPNGTQFFDDMDHGGGFGINFIAVNHHNTVQFLEINPKPGRQAHCRMAL